MTTRSETTDRAAKAMRLLQEVESARAYDRDKGYTGSLNMRRIGLDSALWSFMPSVYGLYDSAMCILDREDRKATADAIFNEALATAERDANAILDAIIAMDSAG